MIQSTRGLPTLEDVCHKHGSRLAFRLRGEYFPGPPPFPESEEETAWLARRESLVLTVVALPQGWLVLSSWTVGGDERRDQVELPREELLPWPSQIESAGGWDLPAIPSQAVAEGQIEFEHEAYEYYDSDPDSLDLEAWKPPRRWRVERRGEGPADRARPLLSAYARFLPDACRAASPLARAFPA